MDEKLLQVTRHFALRGDVTSIKPVGHGHINRTFKVRTTEREYILQRINTYVFPNVKGLMNNIVRVTEHLIDKDVFTLKYQPTYDGRLYYENEEGCYRIYKYIGDAYCYEGVTDLSTIRKAGFAFGQLHRNLADLDPKGIVDIIPDFHNTQKRYKRFLKAVAMDSLNRADEVREEIRFIVNHEDDYSLIVDALDKGEIPTTITHNDPKINNILFDNKTLEVKCVIDLDTMMTGSVLYDFGDAIRSLFTGANEDNADTSQMKVNFDIYREYLTGYYSQMKGFLNEKEIELLPYSVVILTMELAIRFLSDYLEGDIYFSAKREKHNLDRAHSQLALAKDLYLHLDELKAITKEICR